MMSKTHRLGFLAYFFCGSAVLLGLNSLSQGSKYPSLKKELAHHCIKHPKFHPDCVKHESSN